MSTEGQRLRDLALERVVKPTGNLYEECLAFAFGWVRAQEPLARFTSGDIVKAFPAAPDEPRIWGAVMKRLHKDRVIFPTNEWRAHPSASRHHAPVRVWQKGLR